MNICLSLNKLTGLNAISYKLYKNTTFNFFLLTFRQCLLPSAEWSRQKSLATEQSKSAVTDHAITLNHVIDWHQAKVVDRERNKMDRWIKEAIHIRKEQDKSMNRDEGSYQLSRLYDRLFAASYTGEQKLSKPFRRRPQALPKRQQQRFKGCILMKFISEYTLTMDSATLLTPSLI